MPRIGIIVVFVSALLLPILLLALRHPAISTRISEVLPFTQKTTVSEKYSVKSEMPGYTITLADTRYLDYVTSKISLFNSQAIVDPRVYYGSPDLSTRYTVSGVRFVLVPLVKQPVSIITGDSDKGGGMVFLGKGDYSVEGDILVVRVFLDIDALTSGTLTQRFSLEDTYLRTAIFALRHAVGFENRDRPDRSALSEILRDMKEYLYVGVFAWPVRIEAL